MISETVMQAGAARLLHAAAGLGVPDLLSAGPKTCAALALQLDVDAPALHRLLRGWVACGILGECDDGGFELLAEGRPLCRDAVDTEWYIPMEWAEVVDPALAGLPHAVRTGGTAFDQVFGTSVWDYRAAHPEVGARFNANVGAAGARMAGALMAAFDFAQVGKIVDVGGGQGGLAGAIAQAYPALRAVVYDRYPQGAQAHLATLGVGARCEVVTGDFFEQVPAGGEVYLLKAIVHDWNDGEAVRILGNCRRAMAPGTRLLLLERALPARAQAGSEAVFSDVLMLALEHGRERTETELAGLLTAAGFGATRRLPISITAAPDACLIEAVA